MNDWGRPSATAVRRGNELLDPDRPRLRLISFKPLTKNTLRGFCEVELPSGLRIREISIHQKSGKCWAGLPARPVIDGEGRHHLVDGKKQYSALLEWRSRDLSDEFSRRIVALVRAQHPDALDPELGAL
jgi:hypothetical protein